MALTRFPAPTSRRYASFLTDRADSARSVVPQYSSSLLVAYFLLFGETHKQICSISSIAVQHSGRTNNTDLISSCSCAYNNSCTYSSGGGSRGPPSAPILRFPNNNHSVSVWEDNPWMHDSFSGVRVRS